MPEARKDAPPVARPEFSLLDDADAELHSIIHSRLLRGGQKKVSDLQNVALHGAALFTNADDLHSRIDNLKSELEADLLLAEREAKLLASKTV
jgi:hypothetical protein